MVKNYSPGTVRSGARRRVRRDVGSGAVTLLPPQPYRIGSNDVVRIQVYGEDDLTVERKVGGDGKIDVSSARIDPGDGTRRRKSCKST
jgi:hypothetical protein